MRVRDVESHPAGAARANFDIRLGPRPPQPFGDDLGVTNQLRKGESQQVQLDRHLIDGAPLRELEQLTRAMKDVLVRERGRGIDAVHDRVRLVLEEDLKQQVTRENFFTEVAEQVAQYQLAMLG